MMIVIAGLSLLACDKKSRENFSPGKFIDQLTGKSSKKRKDVTGKDPHDALGSSSQSPDEPFDVSSIPLGHEKRQLKSLSSIIGDYTRIFGAAPESLENAGSVFGATPDAWFRKPEIGSVALNVLLNAAVEACQGFVPTEAVSQESAQKNCSGWAKQMWLRDPSPKEQAACVEIALTVTKAKTPKERWTYTCASLMNAAPLLTY